MEIAILEWFQTWHTPALDTFLTTVTKLGDKGIFWIILGVALLFFKRTRLTGISVLISMGIGFLLGNVILKNLVERTRPYDAVGFDNLLIPPLSDYSFPSGHTTASFAAAWVIWYSFRKPGIAALILAALIAVSRMYLFVHYPTDVLGGLVVGSFAAYATIRFIRPRLISAFSGSRAASWFEETAEPQEK